MWWIKLGMAALILGTVGCIHIVTKKKKLIKVQVVDLKPPIPSPQEAIAEDFYLDMEKATDLIEPKNNIPYSAC